MSQEEMLQAMQKLQIRMEKLGLVESWINGDEFKKGMFEQNMTPELENAPEEIKEMAGGMIAFAGLFTPEVIAEAKKSVADLKEAGKKYMEELMQEAMAMEAEQSEEVPPEE